MKIKTIASLKSKDFTTVDFECSAGNGRALWLSEHVPSKGDEVGVEFNIDSKIELEKNAWTTSQRQTSISRDSDNEIQVTGLVDGQDDDGVLYLRVAPNCLIMIESETLGLAGQWIQVQVGVKDFNVTQVGS